MWSEERKDERAKSLAEKNRSNNIGCARLYAAYAKHDPKESI